MQTVFLSLVAALTLAIPNALARTAIDQAQANIPRFRSISDSVFAGGNPTSKSHGDAGKEAIVNLGIDAVISLQGGDIDDTWAGKFSEWRQKGEGPEAIAAEKLYFETRHLRFYNFPLNSHAEKTNAEIQGIEETLRLMAQATPGKPLYLHCEHGADRTGLLIALFRVLHQNWLAEDAYNEWTASGHGKLAKFFTYYLDNYFFARTGWSPKIMPLALNMPADETGAVLGCAESLEKN